MKRSDKRILTTHVGSLIRPPQLLDYANRIRNGEAVDQAAYETTLKQSVAEAVRVQKENNVDIPNDGEYGKSSWAAYVLERVTGFEIRPDRIMPLNWLGRDRERFREFFAQEMPQGLTGAPSEVCVGPITMKDTRIINRDIETLKAALAASGVDEGFFTTVAPASTAYNGINEYYKTDEEYVFAIADALREEYQAVYNSGLVLQVDDAVLTNMYDYLVETIGIEGYRKWAQLRIDGLNHALKGIPEDRIRYHICFGSWHVPHVADAPFSEIVKFVLQVNAGAYSFEAANSRHEHEWTVWETSKLPEGKSILPGVVTHHTTIVEHPDLVAQRIVRFAKLVGRENVIASTDCGFAQSQGTQRVHPSVMWAKLRSLAEGAQIASKQLWG